MSLVRVKGTDVNTECIHIEVRMCEHLMNQVRRGTDNKPFRLIIVVCMDILWNKGANIRLFADVQVSIPQPDTHRSYNAYWKHLH